jgi:hypothetical protein
VLNTQDIFLVQNFNTGIKKSEFDADFEFIKKVAKKSCKKVINRKAAEKLSFLFLLQCAKVFGI